MRITPGHGGTLKKMADAIEELQKRQIYLEQLIAKFHNIHTKLGFTNYQTTEDDAGGGGSLDEINVNTTIFTDGINESTLANTVVWDEEDEQWKWYAVFKPTEEE